MRKLLSVLVAAGLAAAMVVGCGGDDTANPGPDAGSDVNNPPDSQPPDSQPPDSPADGGDAGCNFATFVLGLISNHTNQTDQPSTDLGQNCTDDKNQAEFKSLFP
jgi:hypothetical protein